MQGLIQEDKAEALRIEIKLSVNTRLWQKGYISEELYQKAKELIQKTAGR